MMMDHWFHQAMMMDDLFSSAFLSIRKRWHRQNFMVVGRISFEINVQTNQKRYYSLQKKRNFYRIYGKE